MAKKESNKSTSRMKTPYGTTMLTGNPKPPPTQMKKPVPMGGMAGKAQKALKGRKQSIEDALRKAGA